MSRTFLTCLYLCRLSAQHGPSVPFPPLLTVSARRTLEGIVAAVVKGELFQEAIQLFSRTWVREDRSRVVTRLATKQPPPAVP